MPISFFKGTEYNAINNNPAVSPAKVDPSMQDSNNAYPKSDVSLLSQRSTISGQILSAEGNEVTLLLDNNTTVSARLEGSSQLLEGMLMSFEVKGSNSNSFSLRPLFTNMNNLSAAKSALDAASLPVTGRNLEMTNALMNEGMSISKDALLDMAKAVASYPNENPANIVSLAKIGMPINENNLAQFSNYQNFEHHVINDVLNLSNGIPDLIGQALHENVENGLNMAREIIDLIEVIPETDAFSTLELSDKTGAVTGQNEANTITDVTLNSGNDSGQTSQIQNGAILPELDSDIIYADDLADIQSDTAKGLSADSSYRSLLNELNSVCDKAGLPQISPEANNIDILKMISSVIEKINNAENENNSTVKEAYSNNQLIENISNIINSKPFADMLSDSLKSQLTLKPENVAKEDAISKLYDRTLRQTQKLINVMENAGSKAESLLNSANGINDNINFMNQLNQFVNYVQIPLKMYNQDANGELLVYTNKKNLKDKDGNLTALLHLDMDNLGPMDVYVSMTDYEKVNTHFYMQSEELMDFIEANLHILDERLNSKGYSMKSVVSKKDGGDYTPMTEEFVKDDSGKVSSKVSSLRFDVRA